MANSETFAMIAESSKGTITSLFLCIASACLQI